jgi:hypothetical protein
MTTYTPTFGGQAVFGDPKQFTAAIFTGSAAYEDAFLGLAPGTTVYGPCEPSRGGAIAITGVLTGPNTSTVKAAQATLSARAMSGNSPLLVPTGLSVGGWDVWTSCWFAPTDLAYSAAGIVAAQAGGYQLAYSLIVRRSGSLAT